MVAAGLTKISWSATGYRWDIESNNHMQAKFATAAFLRCADELGQNDMIRLRTKYGTATRIVMVRTGVHLPDPNCWLQKPIDTNRFVCAGAFVLRKQQELLVRAFARHLLRHSAARLELIGDGPLRQRVANVVKELGIQDAVVFRGTMPLEQLRALLRERPISVLPSIVTDLAEQEGIPVVLIEAMANGSPIISTPTGSIRALVLEQCGLLVEPGSVESLATGMALLAAEPDIAAAWAIRAYARLGAEFEFGCDLVGVKTTPDHLENLQLTITQHPTRLTTSTRTWTTAGNDASKQIGTEEESATKNLTNRKKDAGDRITLHEIPHGPSAKTALSIDVFIMHRIN
jgi:hypothetical protein